MINNCPPEKAFWVKDGRTVKNLVELDETLKKIDENVFSQHVDENRNDFANWIEQVIGDQTLGQLMRTARTKNNMQRLVSKRIQELSKTTKNPVKKENQKADHIKKQAKKPVLAKPKKKPAPKITQSLPRKKIKMKKTKKKPVKKSARKKTAFLDEEYKSSIEPANHHIALAANIALGIVVGSALTLLILMII